MPVHDYAESGLAVDMVRELQNKNTKPVQGLILKVSVAVMCRILFNTVRRFAYTFAAVLSRGLGVPLTAITSLIVRVDGRFVLASRASGWSRQWIREGGD